jgi:hypothetical protein
MCYINEPRSTHQHTAPNLFEVCDDEVIQTDLFTAYENWEFLSKATQIGYILDATQHINTVQHIHTSVNQRINTPTHLHIDECTSPHQHKPTHQRINTPTHLHIDECTSPHQH